MAWLELEPSGMYHLAFRYDDQKYKKSLRTKNKDDADARLHRVEENIRLIESGRLTVPDDVDLCGFLLSDGQLNGKPKKQSPIRSLGQLCEAFLKNVANGSLEESTVTGMQIHTRHLMRILGKSFLFRELTLEHLQTYVDKRSREKGSRGKTLSPATIKKELTTLRVIWNWVRHAGHIERALPLKGLRYPKSTEKPPFQTWAEIERKIARGGLSEGEQDALWECLFLILPEIDELLQHIEAAARHPFIFPMFVFAAHTGARRSEMIRSQLDDIDLSSETAIIREKKRVRGKLTTRSVPLSPLLVSVLKQWMSEHPGGQYTFCLPPDVVRSKKTRDELGPISRNEVHDHFKRTMAGSKWAKLRGWHVFRHSFCSNCAAKGIDQRIINAWVGHQTEEMVRRYRHLIPNQQQAAIRTVFGENVGIRSSALQEAV